MSSLFLSKAKIDSPRKEIPNSGFRYAALPLADPQGTSLSTSHRAGPEAKGAAAALDCKLEYFIKPARRPQTYATFCNSAHYSEQLSALPMADARRILQSQPVTMSEETRRGEATTDGRSFLACMIRRRP